MNWKFQSAQYSRLDGRQSIVEDLSTAEGLADLLRVKDAMPSQEAADGLIREEP